MSIKTNKLNNENSTKNQRRDAEAVDSIEKNYSNRSGYNRSRKGNNRSKSGNRNRNTKSGKTQLSQSNPVQLYTKFAEFASDAARIPFATPVGNFISIPTSNGGPFRYAVPGVMAIRFSPVIGVSVDGTSAVNQAAIRFYTKMRSKLKLRNSYEHSDVYMVLLALDSCIMMHSLARRICRVLNDYTPINQYYTQTLVGASGFNWNDVRHNIQKLRGWVNAYGYNLSKFALPAEFSLFERHQWMCEGIYVDSQNEKSQTYVFVPQGAWKFINTTETGTGLDYVQFLTDSKQQYTVDEFIQYADSLLNALSNDDDVADISGDVWNYMGGAGQFLIPYTNEDDRILPVYDQTVLSQIENATIMGDFYGGAIVRQASAINNSTIQFNPVMSNLDSTSKAHVVSTTNLMNLHWDNPTSDQIIEASRLMAGMGEPADGGGYYLSYCGTEIVHRLMVYVRNPITSGVRGLIIRSEIWWVNESTTAAQFMNELADTFALNAFDWAPRLLCIIANNDVTDYSVWTTWDVDNITEIPSVYMQNLNLAVLNSLFEV